MPNKSHKMGGPSPAVAKEFTKSKNDDIPPGWKSMNAKKARRQILGRFHKRRRGDIYLPKESGGKRRRDYSILGKIFKGYKRVKGMGKDNPGHSY